jgi:hybrid cluster-associated redox disulfide protein
VTGPTDYKTIIQIPIQSLLRLFPALTYVFIEHRLACIGCSFSRFHTIDQAIVMHHIGDEVTSRVMEQVIEVCKTLNSSTVYPEGG